MKKSFLSKLFIVFGVLLLFTACPSDPFSNPGSGISTPQNTPNPGNPSDSGNGNGNQDEPTQYAKTEDPDSNGESELPDLTKTSPFAGQSYCDEDLGTAMFFGKDGTVLIRNLVGQKYTSNGEITEMLRQWQKDCLYTYTYDSTDNIITAKMKGIYFGDTLVTKVDDIVTKMLQNTKKRAFLAGYSKVEIDEEYVAIQKQNIKIKFEKELKLKCSITDDSKLVLENISTKKEKYVYEKDDLEIELKLGDSSSISVEKGSYEFEEPYITSIESGDDDDSYNFKGIDFKTSKNNSTFSIKKAGEFSGTYYFEYGSCYFKFTKISDDFSWTLKDLVGKEYELPKKQESDDENIETYLPILKTINYEVIGSDDVTAVEKAQIFITDENQTKWAYSTLNTISLNHIKGIYSNDECTHSVIGKEILDGVKVYVKLNNVTAQEYLLTLGILEDDAAGEVTIIQNTDGLISNPLSLEALGSGYITVKNPKGLKITYIKNSKTKTDTTSSTIFIEVNKGDVVSFYGDNTRYGGDAKDTNINCDVDCYLYGNVMSLICSTKETFDLNPDNFGEQSGTFEGLFKNNTHIKNHPSKELSLPATKLVGHCYDQMFYGCIELTKAPVLVAEELAYGCYETMFYDCKKLSYVKCLAKEVDTLHDTYAWLGNVSKSGFFITEDEDMWGDAGSSAIPAGWIVNPDSKPGVFLNITVSDDTYYLDLIRNDTKIGSFSDWSFGSSRSNTILFNDIYVDSNKQYTYKCRAYDKSFQFLYDGELGSFTPKQGAGELSVSFDESGEASYANGIVFATELPTIKVTPASAQDKVRIGFIAETTINNVSWECFYIIDASEPSVDFKENIIPDLSGQEIKIGWRAWTSEAVGDFLFRREKISAVYGSVYGLPDGYVTIPSSQEVVEDL